MTDLGGGMIFPPQKEKHSERELERADWLSAQRENPQPGLRVELVEMVDDPDPVPEGTRGTVRFVDDAGTVFVSWDNGQGLGLTEQDEWHPL